MFFRWTVHWLAMQLLRMIHSSLEATHLPMHVAACHLEIAPHSNSCAPELHLDISCYCLEPHCRLDCSTYANDSPSKDGEEDSQRTSACTCNVSRKRLLRANCPTIVRSTGPSLVYTHTHNICTSPRQAGTIRCTCIHTHALNSLTCQVQILSQRSASLFRSYNLVQAQTRAEESLQWVCMSEETCDQKNVCWLSRRYTHCPENPLVHYPPPEFSGWSIELANNCEIPCPSVLHALEKSAFYASGMLKLWLCC